MYNYYKMSAETLKFFENQTTEQIINWMLVHLSEDQIRMCLNASGIPDTSNIRGKQPIPREDSSGAGSSGVIPPSTGSPGQGSSTDPSPARPSGTSVQPRQRMETAFLQKFRTKCASTQFVIKGFGKEGVLYYEFKEVESGDDTMGLNIPVDSVGWVKKLTPFSEFKDFCTEEDKIFLEIMKEENMEQFLNAPFEVIQTASEYPSNGLPSPIPIVAQVPDVPVVPVVPVVSDVPEELMTDNMLKAIRIQQASNKIMSETYPLLFSKGLTMYPIFVYNSEGANVMHLSSIVRDGRLQLKQDMTNVKILNSKFKKIASDINEAARLGLYTPSENIRDELNLAVRDIPGDITLRINKIYRPIYLNNFTYFGTLEDEDEMDYNDEVTGKTYSPYEMVYEGETQYTGNIYPIENEQTYETSETGETEETDEMQQFGIESEAVVNNYPKNISSSKKKPSEMTIEEIEDRMRINFGADYVRLYKPEKYVNSLGFTNIRYVRRTGDLTEFKNNETNETNVFSEFGATSDSGTEDLLFD